MSEDSVLDFRQALISVYRQAPCRVLPNALWKTRGMLDRYETDFALEDGQVSRLYIGDETNLILHWDRLGRPLALAPERCAQLKLALLHQSDLPAGFAEAFDSRQLFFRLLHTGGAPQGEAVPGFRLATAHPRREVAAVADLICRCHGSTHPMPEEVGRWIDHPTYDPHAWIWVVDDRRDRPVALGIAEYDPVVSEASLEWVQVLPEYRRRGLGRMIVEALVAHYIGRATWITVSGNVESPSRPERLYRRCGFAGDDIWWVLRR